MALFDDAGTIVPIVRPGQFNQTGDINAAAVIEYGSMVEGTIERRSVLKGHVPMRSVRGTNQIGNFAIGEATLGKVTPGEAPAGSGADFNKTTLTVDTIVLARSVLPLLETFQTQYDARQEIAQEHGKKIAKFFDQSMFIQAAKAALRTSSAYDGGTGGKPAGHFGGNLVTLGASGDATDPAKLYAAIRSLFVQMETKDVIPREDDIMLAFPPAQFYALQDAEQVVNGTYVTANGTKLDNVAIFKAFGCPVVSSNNIPTTNISTHLLGSNYTGDFTKLVGQAFSARALLAGETIPLESDVFYDKNYKCWFVDSHLSYGVTVNRAEYAGAIYLP